MSKNDITGDSLVNKPLSKEGEYNWERIFGKRIKEQKLSSEDLQSLKDVTDVIMETRNVNATDQDTKVDTYSRIDIIGQNGPTGEHYDE